MKKICMLIVLITILLAFVGCGHNDNYPKDDGRRYDTVMEAVYDREGVSSENLLYTNEIENFVEVNYYARGGVTNNLLYKDDKGYFPLKSINDLNRASSFSDAHPGGIISITPLAGKQIVSFLGLTDTKEKLCDVTDNYGNVFKFADYEQESRYDFTYMLVLDEIPEDYRLIVNGQEEKLPTTTGMQIWTAVGISLGAIILLIITAILVKKKKNRMRKYKDADIFFRN